MSGLAAAIGAGSGRGTASRGSWRTLGTEGEGADRAPAALGRQGGEWPREMAGLGGWYQVLGAVRGRRDRVPGAPGAEGTVAPGSGGLLPPSLLLASSPLPGDLPPAPSHHSQPPTGPSPVPCQGPGLVPVEVEKQRLETSGPSPTCFIRRHTVLHKLWLTHTEPPVAVAPCKATLFCHRSRSLSSPLPSHSVSSAARPWVGHDHGLVALAQRSCHISSSNVRVLMAPQALATPSHSTPNTASMPHWCPTACWCHTRGQLGAPLPKIM